LVIFVGNPLELRWNRRKIRRWLDREPNDPRPSPGEGGLPAGGKRLAGEKNVRDGGRRPQSEKKRREALFAAAKQGAGGA